MPPLPFPHKHDSSLVLLSEIIVDELSEVVQGQIDVLSLIFDKQGDIEYSSSGEIDLSQISEKLVFQYEFCSLEPGEYECRVVLRNSITGKGAVSSSLVNIPNESESGIKLDPPLLLIPEKKAVYLKLLRKEKDKSESATLSLNEVYPFVSNRHSPLIEMMDLGISKLLAVLRYSVINIEDPDIVFSAYLVKESSGEKIALEYRILSRKKEQGLDVLLMELPMPLLLSDSYTLEIRADEQKTKSKTQVKRTFVVR